MPDSPKPGLVLAVPAQDQKIPELRKSQVRAVFECFGRGFRGNSSPVRWNNALVSQIWARESAKIMPDDPDYKAVITVDHWPADERLAADLEEWPPGFDMVIRVFHHDIDPDEEPRICANCGKQMVANAED